MSKLTFEDGYNQALKDYESNHNLEKLQYDFAYGLKGFWFHNPKKPPMYSFLTESEDKKNDYKIIVTKYDKGYKKALDDIEKGLTNENKSN